MWRFLVLVVVGDELGYFFAATADDNDRFVSSLQQHQQQYSLQYSKDWL